MWGVSGYLGQVGLGVQLDLVLLDLIVEQVVGGDLLLHVGELRTVGLRLYLPLTDTQQHNTSTQQHNTSTQQHITIQHMNTTQQYNTAEDRGLRLYLPLTEEQQHDTSTQQHNTTREQNNTTQHIGVRM